MKGATVRRSVDVSRHLAPAKVNLRLTVLAREDTGFHQIETLFCALDLADEIELEAAPAGIALAVEGADLGPAERNLVHRAARAFHDATTIAPAVRITLRKHIPAGAGLGGGSSDAATSLRALNRLHGSPLPDEQLLALGVALGSDVPFFLAGAPLALAWGRGDRLLPLPPLPRRPVLIVAPREPMATADAYAALALARARTPPMTHAAVLDPATLSDWNAVAAAARNDFEPTVFARIPQLERVCGALREAGAAPALLSGSGSALFGVFRNSLERSAARDAVGAIAPDARLIDAHTAAPHDVAPPESRR